MSRCKMGKLDKIKERERDSGQWDSNTSDSGKRKLDKMMENSAKHNNDHISVYYAKKISSHNIQNVHRMLNVMRKKRTLARAAIPRSHRNFHNSDDNFVIHPMLAKKKKNSHAKGQFFRPHPDVHFHKLKQEKVEHIRELEHVRDECLNAINDGGSGDSGDNGETVDLIEEVEKMEIVINDAKFLLDILEQNYSFFLSTSVSALIQADDKDVQYKKDAKAMLTREKEDKERMDMASEDSRESKNITGMIVEDTGSTRKKITDFFQPVVGKWKKRTEKFYHDFYHDVLVCAPTRIETPVFKDTPMFLETLPVSNDNIYTNTIRATCPHCGSADLVTDMKTAQACCQKCGVTRDAPDKYQQSFAESQASSTRNTAPYERVSHVSIVYYKYIIYVFIFVVNRYSM